MACTAVAAFSAVVAAYKTRALWDRPSPPAVLVGNRQAQGVLLPAASGGAVDFRATAKTVLPSVVSIDTVVQGRNFRNQQFEQKASSGSGVVISADGYVVTNNHVLEVENFGRRMRVNGVYATLSDGRVVAATIVGTDPRSDLAVLKVEAKGLQPVAIGDATKLEVGEWVVAVGNPLGYENTVSVGVVSSVNRPLPGNRQAVFIDGIQTDAAINMGNSGGALCNAAGQLVGINTAIASIGGGNIGLGFAIPVNRMNQVVQDILEHGRARYGTMGVTLYQPYSLIRNPDARRQLQDMTGAPSEPPRDGVIVDDVVEGGPAEQAGIAPLDVVTRVNGRAVQSLEDFLVVMSPLRPGAKVALRVWSKGKERSVELTLADAGSE
jgi:S1-C subfamily serine protease